MAAQDFPIEWASAHISDISAKCEQRTPEEIEEFVYVDIGSIDRVLKKIATPQTLYGHEAPSRARKVINSGDVLVSLTRPNLNAVSLVPDQLNGQIASTGFEVIKPVGVDSRFIFNITRSRHFIDSISGAVQGALYPAAKSSDVQNYKIPLPSAAEQKEIADRLDILLAQVEATQARLARIPDIIKQFRQSVLAAAVSGKLTEEWRGDSQYDSEGFPSSWSRKGLDDLGALARGKSKHRPRNDPRLFGDKYPFIQTGEVAQSNGVIEGATKWYSEFGLEQSKLFPKGTLCITIAANIADTAILGIDACFPDSVVGFTPSPAVTSALFVKYLIDVNKNNLEQFAPATAQKNINLKVLKSLSLPYPTIEEQTEIVRRVEQLFTYADTLEQQAKAAKARVDKLTQAILAKAFRGELTADWRAANPDLISGDNSAAALLARIQAERATAKPRKRATKKTRRIPISEA